jgi:L-asparaginase
MKANILIIYTGGTIGMVQDPVTGALNPFDISLLRQAIPEIEAIDCQLAFTSFDEPIDSSYIQPEHWVKLAEIIEVGYQHYDGFVILHGSDTIAYTASALSFMLEDLDKPVILTGAQLPVGILRSDARENLITAIEIAAAKWQGRPRVPEVAVYFEFNLYRGNRLFKYSTEEFDAFKSPNHPVLARAGVSLRFFDAYIRKPDNKGLKVHTSLCTDIAVIPLFPGIPDAQIRATLTIPHLKALVLQTYGSGNAHHTKTFKAVLEEASSRELALINVSQCRGGAVEMGKYASSALLKTNGFISAGDMTLEATLCKLMYLLGRGFEGAVLKEFMERELRGELSSSQ